MKSRRPCILPVLLFLAIAGLGAQRVPAPGELAASVAVGDMRQIDELLNQGADPDQPDATGETPLGYAVHSGRIDLVERLLAVAADPDGAGRDGYTPLMRAISQNREDLAVLLLAAGADPNRIGDISGVPASPLSLAVNRGDFQLAYRLFSAGADPRRMNYPGEGETDPLNLPEADIPLDARIWHNLGNLRDSADSPDWNSVLPSDAWALHRAARDNDWRAARDILDAGMTPDAADERGVTPLMAAAWAGHTSLVSLLLQRGAEPAAGDNLGRSALSYAAASGQERVVEQLLSVSGFNGPTASTGLDSLEQSPLFYALSASEPAVMERLLDAGLSPDAVDGEGVNLLMMAAWLGDLRSVNLLLPLVDGGVRDNSRRTALAWCAAAFDRSRRSGSGSEMYPVARLLAARSRDPGIYSTQPTRDMEFGAFDAVEAWSPGRNPFSAEELRSLKPSPVPLVDGDGDLTLYRIMRDEEPGIPAAD